MVINGLYFKRQGFVHWTILDDAGFIVMPATGSRTYLQCLG
jgi:hypothetical protein